MSAQVFLAAFLGCLFALVAVRIATWQFKLWFLRRAMRRVYEGQPFVGAGGMPPTMPPSAPPRRTGTAYCLSCHATQGITDDAAGVATLNHLGWRRDHAALYCPTCAAERPGVREIDVEMIRKPHGVMICERCDERGAFDLRLAPNEVKAKFRAEGWRMGECVCPNCAAAERRHAPSAAS